MRPLADANQMFIARAPLAVALVGFVLAALLTYVFSLGVLRFCLRWNVLDRPEARRVHSHPVPRLGGIAIFLSFLCVSLLLFRPANAHEHYIYLGLILAALLIVVVMAYDDVRGLPPLPRLGVQTLAALIVMFPGAQATLIEVIHNPLVAANHNQTTLALWIAIPFTWFWIVGMMNTINWVDGLDGLASGVVTITALVMVVISWLLGQHTTAILCAVLAGATLGILPLNWHPAKLFMGDSGAMFLGLALAVLSNVGGAKLATMLLLLGLPIFDTARVILRRLRRGHSPLHFDKSHMHHRLLAGGFTQRQIALLFYTVTALFGGVTILAAYLQRHPSLWRLEIRGLPWLDVASTELPTLIGLALVGLICAGILRWATARRKRLGLPSASSATLPRPPLRSMRSMRISSPSASGSHRRP